jgi:rhodanese-related sulfurtransferase
MGQNLPRVLALVIVGGALGLLCNVISPKGIPLITPPKKVPKPEEFIAFDKARELWSSGTTVFLDARSPEDFKAGHIAAAQNLPVEKFQEFYPKIAPLLSMDGSLIVYCDGTDCELSRELADQMRQLGYTNLHMLFNGWTTWLTNGLPTESGAPQ